MTTLGQVMNAETVMLELEWWDIRTGSDIVAAVKDTAADLVDVDSVHVYNPDILDVAPDGVEASLFLSVNAQDRRSLVAAVRDAGMRVKTAATIPDSVARSDLSSLFDWLFASASA